MAAVAPAVLSARVAEAHVPACEELVPGRPESVGMSADRVEDVFARLERRVKDGLFPGAVALIARQGRIVGHRAFGTRVRGEDEPVTLDTLFDVLSITKVVATATAALILVQDGVLRLNDRIVDFVPEFAGSGKDDITVHDMLRYTAGLPIDVHFLDEPGCDDPWRRMAEEPLEYTPGAQVLYSDLTYRLLGQVIEAAAGTDLDTFAKARIWGPLGMRDTTFNPSAALIPRTAATGYSELRGRVVRGEVQDEQDYALGGIAGCDGVFTTARDLAIFSQMLLNGGRYGGVRILSRELAGAMVSNQTPGIRAEDTDVSPMANLLLTPKGYGWELGTRRFSTGGMRLARGSYGKAGGTGTFLWIDRRRELFGVLLTNHGLPTPFDEIGWNRMIDAVGSAEFFDGIINAVEDE
ncbi:serine hydrolase [Sorangium cellulosum]|uniref:Serine hydrolase n=1 Tax=Sorangium cellulosum TaxID=56 RepID=A0A2L0EVX4_SORCE|nr:serine hydrolase domain-containing protein [Sorangium cellulosum]AUX43432.1 serine hydrolase [Sorangium cellulosum]